jgi:hypothetical protein
MLCIQLTFCRRRGRNYYIGILPGSFLSCALEGVVGPFDESSTSVGPKQFNRGKHISKDESSVTCHGRLVANGRSRFDRIVIGNNIVCSAGRGNCVNWPSFLAWFCERFTLFW